MLSPGNWWSIGWFLSDFEKPFDLRWFEMVWNGLKVMAFMARNPREGQVSIGVVEHAMFWDLPPLGTTDVVCNRSLAKLQEGWNRGGRRMPWGCVSVAISHELRSLFLKYRVLEIPLVLPMSLWLTACLNLRSFDPHLFVGNLPQKPILGSNTLMAPIRPPCLPVFLVASSITPIFSEWNLSPLWVKLFCLLAKSTFFFGFPVAPCDPRDLPRFYLPGEPFRCLHLPRPREAAAGAGRERLAGGGARGVGGSLRSVPAGAEWGSFWHGPTTWMSGRVDSRVEFQQWHLKIVLWTRALELDPVFELPCSTSAPWHISGSDPFKVWVKPPCKRHGCRGKCGMSCPMACGCESCRRLGRTSFTSFPPATSHWVCWQDWPQTSQTPACPVIFPVGSMASDRFGWSFRPHRGLVLMKLPVRNAPRPWSCPPMLRSHTPCPALTQTPSSSSLLPYRRAQPWRLLPRSGSFEGMWSRWSNASTSSGRATSMEGSPQMAAGFVRCSAAASPGCMWCWTAMRGQPSSVVGPVGPIRLPMLNCKQLLLAFWPPVFAGCRHKILGRCSASSRPCACVVSSHVFF